VEQHEIQFLKLKHDYDFQKEDTHAHAHTPVNQGTAEGVQKRVTPNNYVDHHGRGMSSSSRQKEVLREVGLSDRDREKEHTETGISGRRDVLDEYIHQDTVMQIDTQIDSQMSADEIAEDLIRRARQMPFQAKDAARGSRATQRDESKTISASSDVTPGGGAQRKRISTTDGPQDAILTSDDTGAEVKGILKSVVNASDWRGAREVSRRGEGGLAQSQFSSNFENLSFTPSGPSWALAAGRGGEGVETERMSDGGDGKGSYVRERERERMRVVHEDRERTAVRAKEHERERERQRERERERGRKKEREKDHVKEQERGQEREMQREREREEGRKRESPTRPELSAGPYEQSDLHSVRQTHRHTDKGTDADLPESSRHSRTHTRTHTHQPTSTKNSEDSPPHLSHTHTPARLLFPSQLPTLTQDNHTPTHQTATRPAIITTTMANHSSPKVIVQGNSERVEADEYSGGRGERGDVGKTGWVEGKSGSREKLGVSWKSLHVDDPLPVCVCVFVYVCI